MGALRYVGYAFIAFLVFLVLYSIIEGIITDSSGFGGLGLSVGSAFLSIPIAIANGIAGIIQSFISLIEHYLNPLNWATLYSPYVNVVNIFIY